MNNKDTLAICRQQFTSFILVVFVLIACSFSGIRDVAASGVEARSRAGHDFDSSHGAETESRAGHG
ncbi:MAG: hypothetical protein HKO64_01630 [Xanthomonadales bacterium]|nr:hypothetical protein [Xanthomonadales bacterium]